MRHRALLAVGCALAALGARAVAAHDFWIEPSTFRPAPGDKVAVSLRVGDAFPGEAVPRWPERIERFALVGPAGESEVFGLRGMDPAGFAVPAGPGLHLLVYDSNHARLTLEGDRFETHLAEQGLEQVSALRKERGESAKAATEIYSRCAKALLQVGPQEAGQGAGYDRALGLPLELVPLADPYALDGGGSLPLLLLYERKPLSGAFVEARSPGREESVSGRTDAAGRIALSLPGPGVWMVKAVHMVPAPAGGDADWESFWASLTFEVPASSLVPPPSQGGGQEGGGWDQFHEEIAVTGRGSDLIGIADSASEGVTGREDLARRPLLRPGELLETVPGVVVTQHSGGGKANQYFVRGFNLDHGTDFRVTVDGVQVNLPSHGHGQGYSDLNFLIPELVESVRYRKGPYYASEGDFAAAGAASLRYVDALPAPLVEAAAGSGDFERLLLADSTPWGGGELLGAVELARQDGPWEVPEDFRKTNGVVRWSRGDAARGVSLTATGYEGSWTATDQVPERAVAQGLLGRFGSLDPSDRGASRRFSLAAELRRADGERATRLAAYAVRSDLRLFSNFTYFLADPENGDQFEQVDERVAAGVQAERQWLRRWAGRQIETAAGFEARADWIDNGLHRTRERERLATTREDSIRQLAAGPYVEGRVRWTPWLLTIAGLRADLYAAEVESLRAENSGDADDVLLSPKLSLLLGPWRDTEVYVNWGDGFHSNDARGATIRVDPASGEPARRVDPLVRARGADLGVRSRLLPGVEAALTVFALELDSELVFVGDAGGTEAGRPSRRTGVELQSFWRPLPWLAIDADFALSRGRFTDADPAGDLIPGAIEEAAAVGVSVEGLGPWSGALRLRHFGPRPLVEDGGVRSRPSTLVNGRLGYRFASGLRLALEAHNLLDRDERDVEYFYESRLPGEPAPVADVHFTPPKADRCG
jgi:uncharacterized GH25 family protein